MSLRLDIMPAPQRRLWEELQTTPSQFVLYGGTALALRLGHRVSIDFDFFANARFTPSELFRMVPYLKNSEIIKSAENTLTCRVDRGGEVQVSFFGGLDFNRIQDPEFVPGIGIKIASLIDLAATKVKVVLDRASYKDYFDIDALINAGIDLPKALAAACAVYGREYNPLLSVKALTFFEEGDVKKLPPEVKQRLVNAVRRVDLEHLPMIRSKPGLLPEGTEL